jgi:dienelactone hydrolase
MLPSLHNNLSVGALAALCASVIACGDEADSTPYDNDTADVHDSDALPECGTSGDVADDGSGDATDGSGDGSGDPVDCVPPPTTAEALCADLVLPPQHNVNTWPAAQLNADWTYHATSHLAGTYREHEPWVHESDLSTPEAFMRWQRDARDVMARVLRLDAAQWENLPLQVRVLESVQLPGVRRDKIDFIVEPGLRVPAYLFIPDEHSEPLPAVLVIHGHSNDGKSGVAGIPPFDREEDYHHNGGLRLAQAGYVVLAPDIRSFGETGSWKQHEHFVQMMIMYGRVAVGQYVADMQRAIDVLAELDYVDAERIGVGGTSLGGQLTQLLAVFDPRVKAAVVAGYLASYRDTTLDRLHCVCQYIPILGRTMDFADIAMLAAPTPVLFVMGELDSGFPPSQSEPAFELVQTAYELMGAREAAQFHMHPEGHRWVQEPAEAFFDANL